MKEDAVLIILEAFVDLVFPKYTTSACEVDEAEKMSTSSTVCYQHEGALQATIRPGVGVRVSKIYASERSS
jgi:hypothetical protein